MKALAFNDLLNAAATAACRTFLRAWFSLRAVETLLTFYFLGREKERPIRDSRNAADTIFSNKLYAQPSVNVSISSGVLESFDSIENESQMESDSAVMREYCAVDSSGWTGAGFGRVPQSDRSSPALFGDSPAVSRSRRILE